MQLTETQTGAATPVPPSRPVAGRPRTSRAELAAVRAATHELARRFHGGDGTTGSFLVDLGPAGRIGLEVTRRRARVTAHPTGRADVVLRTDATTWVAIARGLDDGVRAFLDGRLQLRGDLHAAVRLETLFAPAGPAHRPSRALRTRTGRGVELASLVAGSGTPVVLLHGLAANMLSFLPSYVALAEHHEVHLLDLPGFGSSSKPAPRGRRYHPQWMAGHVRRYLDAHGIDRAHVVGNSMGGRIALELALHHPDRVRSVTGLCPAVAFDHFQALRPLLLAARLQWLGATPVRLPLPLVERGVEELFHDPGAVPRQNIRAAAEDVVRMVHDRGYRLATAAAARHLGAEPGSGRDDYWRRLAGLEVPSLWIFGRHDVLVPWRYANRVASVLPSAQVELWDDLGHVPQFERPEETHAAVGRFLQRLDVADERLRAVGHR